MAPTESPEPVAHEPREIAVGEIEHTDTSFEARMQWPYLDVNYVGNRVQNGRELGCWLAGHFLGRQMYGERGMRVEVPDAFVAGVSTVLLEHGLIVQRYTFGASSVTLDVWAF